MIDILRKCVAMVPPGHRRRWLLFPLLAALAGVVEGGGAGAVYLLVRVLQDPQAVLDLPLIGSAGSFFTGAADSTIVRRFAGLVGVYHLVKSGLSLATQYIRQRIQAETAAELSKTLLRGYLLLPYPFHFNRHSSELIRNTTGSVSGVVYTLQSFEGLLRRGVIGGGLLVILFVAAPLVTLVSGTALAILIMGLLRLTRGMASRSGQEQHELGQIIQQTVQNALSGIKEIKALGREEYFFQAFADAQRRLLRLGYLGVTLSVIPQLIFETAFVLAALVAVVVVSSEPAAGAEVIPLMGLFAYAGFRMIVMANPIVLMLNAIRSGRPAVDDLYDDFLLIQREADPGWGARGDTPALGSELRVEGVSYSYPGGLRPAVAGVTLSLAAGESLGIVGPTGAGKSTLVDLVAGLLTPTEGRILADGVNLGGSPRGWRQRIGYVPQSIFLLDDTLRRNIAMGIPEENIDDSAVQRAFQLAQLDALVASWPDGADSLLGERGVRLSGGERQRVGIARALYHDPDLLVFDEATSALDNVTEAEVVRAIESLRGRKTMLVIAHRLSTVRRCDRLLYLEEGRIVAEGSYDDLLAVHSRFRHMVQVPDAHLEPGPVPS